MGRKRFDYKKRLWQTSLILIVILILVGFRLVEKIGPDLHPDSRFVIIRVIDGDTVELAGGDRLRLLSIDSPERNEPLYDEATSFLRQLVLGKTARIEFAGNRRDKYGRILGYLYVDSVFVNAEIVRAGLAYIYLFMDTERNRPETMILFQAQHLAMEDKTGYWDLPRISEDHYVATVNSFRFHRPGCSNLKNTKHDKLRRFSSREEAFSEGLSPCRNCKP